MFHVDSDKCTGCGACVAACAQGAISLKEDRVFIDQPLCVECGACMAICAEGAICEVTEKPMAPQPAPAAVPSRAASSLGRSGMASAFVTVAPLVFDLVSTLAGRWLRPRVRGRNSEFGIQQGNGRKSWRRLRRRGRR